jgi:MFS family permease
VAESTIDIRPPVQPEIARVVFVIAAVFLGFLTIGMPLPVLSIFVHDQLGYGGLMVGWVIAAQSIATLLTRPIAARLSDSRGPQVSATAGLCACAAAALLYVAAASLAARPNLRLAALFLGRGSLGLGESLLITGALAWGIGLAEPTRTGKVMAWVGIAMYGALAIGAPVGSGLARAGGFLAVAMVAVMAPIVGLAVSRLAPAIAVIQHEPIPFLHAMAAIFRFGAGLALSTMAFGGLIAFLPLLYAERHWSAAANAFAVFGAAYVIMRLVFGGLPDRVGGRRIAIASLLIETIGQTLLWRSATPWTATLGAALTGCGFSLVFPALGTLAVRAAAAMPRGAVLGAYVAFFDLSLGLTGPIAGFVAERMGYSTVFLLGAVGAAGALLPILASPEATARNL